MSNKIHLTLSFPTVFPDLNAKEGKDQKAEREFIEIERMKYGHIKEMQIISAELQTQWAIQKLTGLSHNDIDELYTEDAAEITKIIFGFIEKYFLLAKKMWQEPANGEGAIS